MSLYTCFFLIASVVVTAATFRQAKEKPNFLILIADDLGYGDIASYGHQSQEYNELDQMAAEGLMFTQGYSGESVCTAARAALLTGSTVKGRYAIRSGMIGGMRVFMPVSTQGLPREETTIPEMLKEVGYVTGMVGKWHLGMNRRNNTDSYHMPHNHGFDYVGRNIPLSNAWQCDESGVLTQGGPGLGGANINCVLYNYSTVYAQPTPYRHISEWMDDDYHYFIKTYGDQPFFFYYSFPQTHDALFSWQTKFAETSRRGVYGGDVAEMAHYAGRAINLLKLRKLDKNTLVLFMSDHGPHRELCMMGGETSGLKGGKATHYEGGFRTPFIAWWPGVIKPNQISTAQISQIDLLPTIAKLAGTKVPSDRIDGLEMVDVLLGKTLIDQVERPLYFYCNQFLMSIRYGKYKVHFYTVPLFGDADYDFYTCPNGVPLADWFVVGQCLFNELIPQDPPIIYNLDFDPQELYPLDYESHKAIIEKVTLMRDAHLVDGPADRYWNKTLIPIMSPHVAPCCSGNPANCACNYTPPPPHLQQRYKEYLNN